MRKHLVVLFTVYFFISSTGLLYSKHFCGKRSSRSIWGINISDTKACQCKHDGKDHKKKCCTTTSQWHKANFDAAKHFHSSLNFQQFLAPTLFIQLDYIIDDDSHILVRPNNHSPPVFKTAYFIIIRKLLI